MNLILSPRRAYTHLRAQSRPFAGWYVLRYPLLVSLVFGTSIALAATASVDIPLVLSASLSWSVAPLIQMAGATVLVLSVRERPVTVLRGVDGVMAGHVPWSLWLLGMGACLALGVSRETFVRLAVVALIVVIFWRAFLVFCLLRHGLDCSRMGAAVRTVLHQAAMWALLFLFIEWAIGLPARLS